MALKYKFQTREEIPAEHAALYVERDGAFYLDAEGVTDKAKADELRDNNIALKKQIEEHTARYDGIDPDEFRRLAEEKRKLELQAQGHKPEEIDKLVTERLKVIKADLDKQLLAKTNELETANSRLTTIQIDQGVITVATKRGLRPTALPDITSRARTVFKLVNGAPQAFEPDGKTVRYGRDGISPMTLEEWVDAQVSEAPHLFESNAGGGAASNGAGCDRTGERPVRARAARCAARPQAASPPPAAPPGGSSGSAPPRGTT